MSRGIPKRRCSEGMWWILCRAPMQMCDFGIIVCWLWQNLQVSVVNCVLFEHLSVGLLLGDYPCEIVICHYCFLRMYYFKVLHVFYVINHSLSCNVFYLILKAILNKIYLSIYLTIYMVIMVRTNCTFTKVFRLLPSSVASMMLVHMYIITNFK